MIVTGLDDYVAKTCLKPQEADTIGKSFKTTIGKQYGDIHMRIIFVRHGEPDYSVDGLSERGIKEAMITAERIKKWNVKDYYVSPLGRALQTARPTLDATGRSATTLPWLREFSYPITDPTNGRHSVPWDYVPSHWTNDPLMFSQDKWMEAGGNNTNPELSEKAYEVWREMDKLLEKYGYYRKDRYYININREERFFKSTVIDDKRHLANEIPDEDAGDTIVMFCHFGVTCLILSHLLNIPFEPLAQGTLIPCCGITTVYTEERWGKEASFRLQSLGDVSHFIAAGEPISSAGSFAPLFQG